MIAAIPSLASALSSATSMRGLREEIAAVRTVFITREVSETPIPLLKQIAWICQYQLQGDEAILRSGYKPRRRRIKKRKRPTPNAPPPVSRA